MKKKFTIKGRTYDLEDAADLVSIQNALVPDNWPTKKADCVRLFLSSQEMLSLQLKRHLAANWKAICKAAQENQEPDGGGRAELAIGFGFTLDQTAPMIAAISKIKMAFSVKHSTEGRPITHDLSQGEFLDEDMSVVFQTGGIEKEKAEAAAEEKKAKEDAKIIALPAAGPDGEVTPESEPGDAGVDKKPRSRKK